MYTTNNPKSISDLSLASFFAVLSDPTRIRILKALLNQEQNVGSLAEKLNLSISAISHQLRILSDHDLVRSRRAGRFVYYRISDVHVPSILQTSLDHLSERDD